MEKEGALISASFLAEISVKETPKIVYFSYLIKHFPGRIIQILFYLILKTEALALMASASRGN